MKKILLVVPHLSTGGLPQYTLKQIQSSFNEYDFYCVEWDNIGGTEFVVQRNKISNLMGKKFYSLGENKEEIISIIESIQPDVIHFQEIPETFIPSNILDVLYFEDRWYNIVVTTHSSNTNPENITYTADKFILVSEWSKKIFVKVFGEEMCDIWEYPIEKKSYDKIEAKQKLNFDPKFKHILNVGLFTMGKNQGELIDLARKMINYPVIFHFVGNQALNFKDYWEPLMKNLPSNCIWHGERDNVEEYYMASDLFYFPSNFELNPLVVKESLSYGLPTFIKKLESYHDTYDDDVSYIQNDQTKNIEMIKQELSLEPKTRRIQVVHLLTEITHEREQKSIESISKLSQYGFDYLQKINQVYDEIPPKEFCSRPDAISDSPKHIGNGYGNLTGRHYGCFLAHTNALKEIDENYDYTIIFEADANIETSYEEFVEIVNKCCEVSERDNVYFFGLANNPSRNKIDVDENFTGCKVQDLAHAYLIPNRYKSWYVDRISDVKWDGYDIWLNDVFCIHPQLRYTTKKVYSSQINGMSLIDNYMKWETTEKNHLNYVEIGTSDFETLVEILPENYVGISIEPIEDYLNKLPSKLNNKKINCAISDNDGVSKIHYVSAEDVQKYNLPDWIKGCNSIDSVHPSAKKYLNENGIDVKISSKDVKRISFKTLIDMENIGSIDFLKIDTEGHDFVILKDVISSGILPKKIQFEANSLYSESSILDMITLLEKNGYHLTQRTINDVTVSMIDESYNESKKPILILSTGRRLDYFTKTIRSLFDKNPNFNKQVEKVWVLDDRSSHTDRLHMEKIMSSYFGDNYNTVSFNSNEPFYFVNKFNLIKKLINIDDVVLLIEDDWECHDNLRLEFHVNSLLKSDWTQISFADPLEIQDADIQMNYMIDFNYWKNPYPNMFKHPYKWDGDICYWNKGFINNWTNNPSLIKGEVFFREDFIISKNFEFDFASKINGNQVFTNECLFRHFGENSLINKL